MRKLILLAVALFVATAAFSQVNVNKDADFSSYYRGFVDAGWGVGQFNGDRNGTPGFYGYRQWICELSTTHGVQLSPELFVGGGISMLRAFDAKEFFFPVFGAVRYSLADIGCKPYAEGRLGLIAFNSVQKEKYRRYYVAGSLGVELLPYLQLGGRLTLMGLNNDKSAFCASLFLAVSFGGQ